MNASEVLNLSHQRRFFADRPRWRLFFLIIGIIGIIAWQTQFVRHQDRLDRTYRNQCAGGQNWDRHLVFFYYTGLFPVNTTEPTLPQGKEAIWKLIREKPETIYTWSNIERFSIFFHYLDALIRQNPYGANFKITTASAFILTLIALFFAFWIARLEILGFLIVLLIGSNPFQLYEAYRNPNIFGWPILIGLFVMALWIPLLTRRVTPYRFYPWIAAFLSGFIAGTARHIRPEGSAIIVSAFLICFFLPQFSRIKKVMLALLCIAALWISMYGWSAFFSHQHRVTNRTLATYGVKVDRNSVRVHYHPHWQGFLCGLGDFDTKYGYLWDDRVSYAVANMYGLSFNESCKKKIFTDIKKDPLWYLEILTRRLWRILAENTPLRLSWGASYATIPIAGYCFPILLALLIVMSVRTREFLLLKIVLFSAPIGAVAFLMFSGYGESYFSITHIFIASVFLALLIELAGIFKEKQTA